MPSTNRSVNWYCFIDGVEHGPVTADQLRKWAAQGKLRDHHLVWRDGSPGRVPARHVKGLLDVASTSASSTRDSIKSDNSPKSFARDVFISYSSKDKLTADAICATLERDRIRCWIAPRDVIPGVSYGEAIIDAINVSRVMVVVLSAASNGSPQVLREVERGVNKGLPIVPFRIEEVKPTKSMEYFLSAPHWLDALSKPLEAHIERLSKVVRAVLEPGRFPRPVADGPPTGQRARTGFVGSLTATAFTVVRSLRALLRPVLSKIPRRTRQIAVGLGVMGLLLAAVLIWNKSHPLSWEYKDYRSNLISGRGSIAFLKKAAPLRYTSWRTLAESGDPIAQLFVARCYQEGLVVTEDSAAAIPWFEKSAAQGNDLAMHTLGLAYLVGHGVPIDRAQAIRWYTQAADRGNTTSMLALGDIYGQGLRNKPDPEAAYTWYRKAADSGNPSGMRVVGDCYLNGRGVPKNAAEADRWYQRAADAGDACKAGRLLGKRLAPPFAAYIAGSNDEATRTSSLAELKQLQAEYKALDLIGVVTVFEKSDFRAVKGDVQKLGDTDPLQVLFDEMLQHYIKCFGAAEKSERVDSISEFSGATDAMITRWFNNDRFSDIAEFWENCYKDISISALKTPSESNALIRQFNFAISSLMRTGKRKEARELLQLSLTLCDWLLSERHWDWYVKDAYSGLCFQTAETLTEVGEPGEAQALLKRAWGVRLKQYGKEDILDRYAILPLKGKVPVGATSADREFFEKFGPNADKSKSGIKRFTIPCNFDDKKYPFDVYVIEGPRGYAELQDQFRWLKEFRGGEVPAEVKESFRKLNKIAFENNVDFMNLCVYALGIAPKDAADKK